MKTVASLIGHFSRVYSLSSLSILLLRMLATYTLATPAYFYPLGVLILNVNMVYIELFILFCPRKVVLINRSTCLRTKLVFV